MRTTMISKSHLLLATLLSGSMAFAQQPTPSQSPAPPPSTSTSPDAKLPPGNLPRARGMMRENFEHRMMGPNDMAASRRIAPAGTWWRNPDMVQALSLSADQQKRMNDVFQQARLQLIDLKANVEKQNVLLEPMLDANPPDTAKVLAQIDRVAQARAELEKTNAKMLLGIRSVLTPEQWTKLQAEERSHRPRMMPKMPPQPGRPPSPGALGPEGLLIPPPMPADNADLPPLPAE